MEPTRNQIPGQPARQALEMLLETYDFYFPPGMRGRFESVADRFEEHDQDYWIDKRREKMPKILEAFQSLFDWADMSDSELLMFSWDDEVLFFYVLRTQYVFARLAASPNDVVPAGLDDFWRMMVMPKEDDPWMIFPVVTKKAIAAANIEIPIWRIPYPIDYPKDA